MWGSSEMVVFFTGVLYILILKRYFTDINMFFTNLTGNNINVCLWWSLVVCCVFKAHWGHRLLKCLEEKVYCSVPTYQVQILALIYPLYTIMKHNGKKDQTNSFIDTRTYNLLYIYKIHKSSFKRKITWMFQQIK